MQLDFTKTSGNYKGDQRTNKWISNAVQDLLDGKSMAEVVGGKVIKPVKFLKQTVSYSGNEGTKSYSRTVFRTDVGDIIVSEGLGAELGEWKSNLGDLTFKKGVSEAGREFFRLQRPGGGVTESEEDIDLTTGTVTKETALAGN